MIRGEYAELVGRLRESFKEIWRCVDWSGTPMVGLEVCGKEEPPILVTAGAHGDEPAGVYAAVELAYRLNFERKVVIVPSRDPSGFHSLNEVLKYMVGSSLKSLDELPALVREYGGEEVYCNGRLYLGFIRNVGFTYTRSEAPQASTAVERALRRVFSEEGLYDSYYGNRILVPAMTAESEGSGLSGQLYTLFVGERGVLAMTTLERMHPYPRFMS